MDKHGSKLINEYVETMPYSFCDYLCPVCDYQTSCSLKEIIKERLESALSLRQCYKWDTIRVVSHFVTICTAGGKHLSEKSDEINDVDDDDNIFENIIPPDVDPKEYLNTLFDRSPLSKMSDDLVKNIIDYIQTTFDGVRAGTPGLNRRIFWELIWFACLTATRLGSSSKGFLLGQSVEESLWVSYLYAVQAEHYLQDLISTLQFFLEKKNLPKP